MSRFTDRTHLEIVVEAAKWENHIPKTAREMYEFARFQYRVKDYYKAVVWFKKAAGLGHEPACYCLAVCMDKEEGIYKNDLYEDYCKISIHYYKEHQENAEDIYRLAMCFRYGLGCNPDRIKAKELFESVADQHGGACYELGKISEPFSAEKASQWYRKAYDLQYEDAIFRHYAIFDGPFDEYPYQREMKEAYSFRLGQLMRVAQVAPSKDTYRRVAEMYEHGYPGDEGEEKIRYQERGKIYRKKMEEEVKEFNYGELFVYHHSQIYQDFIKLKDMSEFAQKEFLQENL